MHFILGPLRAALFCRSQAIGTHNSYHVTPDDAILTFLTRSSTRALLGASAAAQVPSSWEATQAVLATQIRNYGEAATGQPWAGSAAGRSENRKAAAFRGPYCTRVSGCSPLNRAIRHSASTQSKSQSASASHFILLLPSCQASGRWSWMCTRTPRGACSPVPQRASWRARTASSPSPPCGSRAGR